MDVPEIHYARSVDVAIGYQVVGKEVAGSGFDLGDRGTCELKGVPGEWHLYSVTAGR